MPPSKFSFTHSSLAPPLENLLRGPCNGAVRGGREKGQQIFSLQNLREKKMPALSRLETHAQLLGMASGSVRVLQYKKNWYCFPDRFTEMGAI